MEPQNQRQLQVGVKIFIKNDEGRVLLLKRNRQTHRDVGDQWDIPGGRINAGESLFVNLSREVTEETGLTLIGKPKIIFAQDIFPEGKHVVRITYTGKATGTVVLSKEHIEFAWVSRETALSMLDVLTSEALRESLDLFQV